MNIQRIAAFSRHSAGGNPAGVVIQDELPDDAQMQQVAAEVGYSETAFAQPHAEGFRVRYFSPENEVPFCGHATIALGAALAQRYGNAVFRLYLNEAEITVDGRFDPEEGSLFAALQSPATRSTSIRGDLLTETLALFDYSESDLDKRIPPAHIHAGANHLVLMLESRESLRQMHYQLDTGRELMLREGLVTILVGWIEHEQLFHTRNAFASGGVLEDPATGAATAALAGYLRDLNWPHQGKIQVIQGEDMGKASSLLAEFDHQIGSSIRVSGQARLM